MRTRIGLVLVAGLLLSGCFEHKYDKPLTNQQVADIIHFCQSHGLASWTTYNAEHEQLSAIQCIPADDRRRY